MKQAWEATEPGRAAKVSRSHHFVIARDGKSRNAPISAFSLSFESDCASDFFVTSFFFFPGSSKSPKVFERAHSEI